MPIRSILFVSWEDVCRGPMAAALLKREICSAILRYSDHPDICSRLQRVIGVESVGTYAIGDCLSNRPAHPFAVKCMDELEENPVDIRSHRSRSIHVVSPISHDLMVCMGEREVSIVTMLHPGGTIILADAHGDEVPSPRGNSLEAFRQCAKTLKAVAHAIVEDYLDYHII